MRCQSCNYNNKDTVSFCIMCGTKIASSNSSKREGTSNTASKKLAYVVSDNEIVDENLLQSTTDVQIGELISYTSGNVMDKRCFKYNILDVITLKEYISKPLKKDDFLTLLLNLLNAISGLTMRGLKLNNIFLKASQIFVNQRTLMVKLICVPIVNRKQDKELGELVKEIILSSEFDYNENCKYVKDLLKFFNENRDFNINLFQDLIEKTMDERDEDEEIQFTRSYDSTMTRDSYVEDIYIAKKEKNKKNSHGYDEVAVENKNEALDNNYINKKVEGEGTTVLSPQDAYGTTVLVEREYAYLIRLRNNRKIEIDKDVFKIGADRNGADYVVDDNPAVSRRHAEIIYKYGRYFIIDNGSTNHTFINGKRIEDKKEVELDSNVILKLANEEFKFFIE